MQDGSSFVPTERATTQAPGNGTTVALTVSSYLPPAIVSDRLEGSSPGREERGRRDRRSAIFCSEADLSSVRVTVHDVPVTAS